MEVPFYLLMMFVFRCTEPWYQKDKHHQSCVDDVVSCLLNLVDAACLSVCLFVLCKNTYIEMTGTMKNISCTLSEDWHEAATEKLPVL